jgi:hypothetical protein
LSEQQLKVGDRVQFNIAKVNGPLVKGTVTRADNRGLLLIKPDDNIGPNIQFFNIKKVDK